ncbi:MAG: hypothetical protein QOH24_2167 [Verrucomicrobiota bacterium]|jgi:hypothetical protein
MVFLNAWLWSFAVAAGDIVLQNLPGGYAPAELSKEVKAAADFAIDEQARREAVPLKLVSIARAEKQIVAGTNYRLFLTVERSGSTRQTKVVVFQDLGSHYSLKSWEWL